MKKIIGFILCVCIAFSMLSVSAVYAAGTGNYYISEKDWDSLCDTVLYAAQVDFYFNENTAAEDILYKFVINPYNEPLFEKYYRTEEKYDYYGGDSYVDSKIRTDYPFTTVYDAAVTDIILKKYFNVSENEISKLHKVGEIHEIDDGTSAFYYDGAYYVSWVGGYGGPYDSVVSRNITADYGNGKYGIHFKCKWDFDGNTFDIYCVAKKSDEYASNAWCVYSVSNEDNNKIKVILDGSRLYFEQDPIIKDDRTLVPMRAIFEAMGADVDWDGNTRTITGKRASTQIKMQIGSRVLEKNGISIYLDVPAQLIDGYTMIPVRAVAESFGSSVDWDNAAKIVYIDTH